MGSQLLRASTPESDGPPYFYNIVWLDCSDILGGAAAHLRMQGDIDFDGQFVIADGPVNFPPLTPYQGFINKCNQQQIDYLIFGWDWRRDLCLTADFFLKVFMPLFKQRVAGLQPSPLQRLSLVGHSFGGMLIKLILNSTNDSTVQQLKSAVTVASPFYGYGGQLPHYFVGDPDLNPVVRKPYCNAHSFIPSRRIYPTVPRLGHLPKGRPHACAGPELSSAELPDP